MGGGREEPERTGGTVKGLAGSECFLPEIPIWCDGRWESEGEEVIGEEERRGIEGLLETAGRTGLISGWELLLIETQEVLLLLLLVGLLASLELAAGPRSHMSLALLLLF